ncbi:ISAs1 family transposase [Burkholderia ubonensis]|uniref:ISAs1 family transposase n=1 Tax=Burkholderia ubonensis TaxID=101571 RepID=UPI0009B3A1C6|nr:ISAs1 family transposase [Burkholderia ubonensis]
MSWAQLERIRYAFDAIERVPDAHWDQAAEHQDIDKDRGRIETRRCIASDVLACWEPDSDLWLGLRSIVMVETAREIGNAKTIERRYYVSSLPADAVRIAWAVRAHWRIESSMHRELGMTFGEDQCRVRVDNAARNFAIPCRISLNLLTAGANDGYRAAVLRLWPFVRLPRRVV